MKLNTKLIAGSILSALIFSGCSDSSTTANNPSNITPRFVAMSMNEQIVMQDMTTGLEWVNGTENVNVIHGCFPMGAGFTQERAQTDANDFCENLDFASHTDWRLASDLEIQEYTLQMNISGFTPFYANPACPRVIGKNIDGELRTINTHNTNPIGTIKEWESLNAGVRCVRMTEMNATNMMP